jgi:ABC-type phosphate transport system auxiliary subunit
MRRSIVFLLVIALLAFAGWKGYQYFYKAPESLVNKEAVSTLTAPQLIQAFEKDSATANKAYLGKVVAVEGVIRAMEPEDGLTIILGEEGSMSSVRCSMDTTQQKEWTELKKGQKVLIKGNCTGYTSDELLGADVILNRCVL